MFVHPPNRRRPFRFLRLLLGLILLSSASVSGQEIDRLDPTLKKMIASPSRVMRSAFRPATAVTASDSLVDVFIRTTGSPRIDVEGVIIKSVIGSQVIASVPVNRLLEVATLGHVRSVRAAGLWKTLLDRSVPETRASTVRSTRGVTGKGVIVGIIDTGIDWRHSDFRDENGATRVVYFWDMGDASGPPPRGFEGAGGTEVDSVSINRGINQTAFLNVNDRNGHGTHVSGIAASNGRGSGFVGVAPGADLIVVNASRNAVLGTFSSADVITALKYIDTKARELGKPYVVNMSLGAIGGPADGTGPEATAIDSIVGPGKPGKVVVVAAGNDGGVRKHARDTLNSDRTVNFSKTFSAKRDDVITVEVWSRISPNDINKILITVTGPDTTFGPVTGFPMVTANHHDGDITVVSSPYPHILTGTDIETRIDITTKQDGPWTIQVRGSNETGSGTVDMWLFGAQFSEADGDDALLIGQPGSTRNAITVASYVTRSDWTDQTGRQRSRGASVGTLSAFSSPGPTRDSRQKPDVAAPGEAIASSLASLSVIFGTENLLSNSAAMLWGTSMAAPHVTGAIALAFEEANRQSLSFDARQVKDALIATARSDAATGTVPNARWGYGKLDAEAFVARLLGSVQPTAVSLASFTGQADGRQVQLAWEVTQATDHAGFQVYRSATGRATDRRLITPQILTGGPRFTFDDVPPAPGTYAYWLADVALDGTTTFHGPVVVTLTALPRNFRLGRNRPNPFNPSTAIEYDLPEPAQVTLRVYNLLGRHVRTLVDARQPAGFHSVVWDGRDDRGATVGSGVYLYRIIAGRFTKTRKMTLLK